MPALPRISSDTKTGGTAVSPHDPSQPSTNYLSMLADWEVVRTVYEGTRAMREAREEYLPKHVRESDQEYERRLQCTTLTNILRDSVQNTCSRPFRKKITLTETSPAVARTWSEDIDMMGMSLHMFAVRAFREALIDGMVHVLIDMSVVPEGATKAEENALRTRPFFTLIPARNLIAAYTRTNEANEAICFHARILEISTELDGFQEVEVKRVRVYHIDDPRQPSGEPIVLENGTVEPYFPARWSLWEQTNAGWVQVDGGPLLKSGGISWDRVPLQTFYTGSVIQPYLCTPTFLDLAWKNVEHWQSSSDQRNILTKSRFPILAASGVEDPASLLNSNGELEVGPHMALVTPHKDCKWYYVEPQGNAIEAGFKDLKQLTEDMRIMGIDPLLPQNSGSMTATESSIDESKARAPLEQWAWEFTDFITRCFDDAFRWVGLVANIGTAKILLDTDMGIGNQKLGDLQTLIQLRQTREISRGTLFEELKRRGLLGPYFDAEIEQQNLEAELLSEAAIMNAANAANGDDGFDSVTGEPDDPSQLH
jgi:hypothetical protein